MPLGETMKDLESLLDGLSQDLSKVHRGNRSAAQRVRVNTVKLEKVAKQFRRESLLAEKGSGLKKKSKRKKLKKMPTNVRGVPI